MNKSELHLLGKKIHIHTSPVLLKYSPDENWKDYFDVKAGEWECKDGYLIGAERGNKGGILFTKDAYEDGTMMTSKVSTMLPATRDLNAVFCAEWDEKTDYLGESYVCGLKGWYEHKSGLELYGTKGSLLAEGTIAQDEFGAVVYRKADDGAAYDASQVRSGSTAVEFKGKGGNMYTKQITAFGDAIINNTEVPVTAEDAILSQKIVEAAYMSSEKGVTVKMV